MQKINKIFIVSIISLCCIFGTCFSDNSDCGIFAIWNYANNWSSDNSFQIIKSVRWREDYIYSKFLNADQQLAIIDSDSLNTAVLNLKKYCCENGLWWLSVKSKTCQNDKAFYNTNSLDSEYLFDHLFDVIMRRLSWLTWENDIYVDTKMTVDELWAERRSRINEKAEDLSGSDVQSIIDKYKEFWEYHWEYDITSKMDAQFWNASNRDFLEYVSGLWWEESKKIAKAFQEYKNRSMYDRYHNACALTEYFYALINWGIESTDKIRTINTLSKWICNTIVKNQIANENKYVWIVANTAWNLMLINNTKFYTAYLYSRRNDVRDLQTKTNDRWWVIVKAVPHLVKATVH